MYKLLTTLLIASLPSLAYAHCAAQADEALEQLRNAHDAINDSYDLYDEGKYERAITKAIRAKNDVWEGQTIFKIMLDRGLCDWEGPSVSEVKRYIKNTKISDNQARCVISLAKMGKVRNSLKNMYKAVNVEERKKSYAAIHSLGKKALGYCEDGWHNHIRSILKNY